MSHWPIVVLGVAILSHLAVNKWEAKHPEETAPLWAKIAALGSVLGFLVPPFALVQESVPAGISVGVIAFCWYHVTEGSHVKPKRRPKPIHQQDGF